MSKKEERAGAAYAADQIEDDYFMNWVRDQMYEASQMDPSQVLPLETKADAKVIARNMLQQLGWDVKRDLNESPDFFEGFSEYLKRPKVIDWLADEVLSINEELRSNGTEEAKRKRHPEMTGGVFEFAELLKSLVDTQGRYLFIRTEHRLGGPAHYYESVYVNFVNLPEEIVARKAGGGAEAANNRMSFWIEGFDGSDPQAPPPTGKVKIEMRNSTLPREYRLRAKTAPPGAIAQYLADFLNKVVREVPPNYTHTRDVQEAHRAREAPRSKAPPKRFKSPGGRTFTLGPVERISPRMETWPILYKGKPAGGLSRDDKYRAPLEWHASVRELYWKYASGAPTGIGFDVAAFATPQEALDAWGRSADQILDWSEGKPVGRLPHYPREAPRKRSRKR